MKRALPLFAIIALLALAACGQNPLLKSVSADFAPIRVGSEWNYVDPAGSGTMSRKVIGAGTYQGREAFTVVTQVNSLPPTTDYWSFSNGVLEEYDATLGWILLRRLPYVFTNKWNLETGNPLVTSVQTVESLETITTPVGKLAGTYRLKTKTSTYDAVNDVTNTVESLLWAAPNIGDVRYADVDASGNVTVTLTLSSYRIP